MRGRRYRDERLGAALRELRPPRPRPGFWEVLETRLAEEAPTGRDRPLRPPPRFRRWALAAGVAAALVAIVIGVVPRGPTPPPAAAAEMRARLRATMATLEDVRIRGSWRDRSHGDVSFRLVVTVRGDVFFHQEGSRGVGGADAGRTITVAYDASRGIERVLLPGAPGSPPRYSERRGVAPGPPDHDLLGVIPPRQRLAAAIGALLAAEDPSVSEATWRGRDAWRAVLPVQPTGPTYPGEVDRLTVVVDRETGLPVRILGTRGGRFVERMEVRALAVNHGVRDGRFRLSPPPGAEVTRGHEGFRRVPLAEAGAIVGYDPLAPRWAPDGFRLTEVAVAAQGRNDLGRRWTRGVVSLSYRRGFDQLVITTRRAPGPPRRWGDPLDLGLNEGREPLVLSAGALAGSRGELVLGPRELPHVWTHGEGLLLTVAGPLSREELLHVARSLEPR